MQPAPRIARGKTMQGVRRADIAQLYRGNLARADTVPDPRLSSRMTRVNRRLAAVTLSTGLAIGVRGFAQNAPPSSDSAAALFDEGRRLMAAGDFERACPKFAESQRLDPGGGTLLNLAVCHEKQGKIATAWGEYNAALSLATRDRRQDREAIARAGIASLAAVVPRVSIVVSQQADVPQLAIRVDGGEVPRSSWGTPLPMDPGQHVIEASAPGHRALTLTSMLRADGAVMSVEVPVLPMDASVAPPSATVAAPPPVVATTADEGTRVERSPLFYVGLSFGIAGLTTSAVTGVLALLAHQSVGSKCDRSTGLCVDASGVDDASRARTMAWVSTVALAVGIVGAVVMLAAPSRSIQRGRAGAAAP
jgi:hypothetical protein